MKCSKCHYNEASVYIEQTTNGHTQKAHLCSDCASLSDIGIGLHLMPGGGIDPGLAFQYAHNFWFAPESESTHKRSTSGTLICSCGYSFNSFKKSSMLGCASCYEAFEAELLGVFSKLQPGIRHVGKIPETKSEALQKDLELFNLKEQLKTAICNEEFEKAAKIRDTIRELEGSK